MRRVKSTPCTGTLNRAIAPLIAAPSRLRYNAYRNAGIAQLVERNLAKVEVESSRLFARSKFKKGKVTTFPFFTRRAQRPASEAR